MRGHEMDRLEDLRDEWARKAMSIEYIYGQEEPAARAIRECISELGTALCDFDRIAKMAREARAAKAETEVPK